MTNPLPNCHCTQHNQCEARLWEDNRMRNICTRELGHEGEHIACGDKHDIVRWKQEDER